MADFEIDVGFNQLELNNASGISKGSSGSGISAGGIGGGLKIIGMVGLVGMISKMKAVMDTISFIMSSLSTGLVYLVGIFVQYITPFFKDPMRFLLSGMIDLANMIISGLEMTTNVIVSAINALIPGTSFDIKPVEFGRFQKDIILQAYDNMKDTITDQESSVDDMVQSIKDFSTSFIDGFMTNTEYSEQLNAQSEEANIAMIDGINGVKDLGYAIQDKVFDATKFIKNLSFGSSSRSHIFGARTLYDKNLNEIPDLTNKYNLNIFGKK